MGFELVKVVVIGKASCWESLPESMGSWEEAAQVNECSSMCMAMACVIHEG